VEALHISFEGETIPLDPTDQGEIQAKFLIFLETAHLHGRSVNLHLAGIQEIQELNRSYRNRDQATDILSFAYGLEEEPIGDLALCLEVAKTQAKQNGWELKIEILRLLAHGLVHLMGYDHETGAEEKEMLEIEIRLLNAADLREIYPSAGTTST